MKCGCNAFIKDGECGHTKEISRPVTKVNQPTAETYVPYCTTCGRYTMIIAPRKGIEYHDQIPKAILPVVKLEITGITDRGLTPTIRPQQYSWEPIRVYCCECQTFVALDKLTWKKL